MYQWFEAIGLTWSLQLFPSIEPNKNQILKSGLLSKFLLGSYYLVNTARTVSGSNGFY